MAQAEQKKPNKLVSLVDATLKGDEVIKTPIGDI
jgi:hypothetical protein